MECCAEIVPPKQNECENGPGMLLGRALCLRFGNL
jgi:hypothetical protein